MKTSYNGRTTVLSDNLFEKPIVTIKAPKLSLKFGTPSLYYDGRYYFFQDIKESHKREGKPFEVQAVFHSGKWLQDTIYITEDFKDLLDKHSND